MADIAYHSSPNQMDFGDRTLQDSCQKKNGGLHAREYLPVQAVSPYRTCIPTKAEHDFESPMSIYEFTRENTHKYNTHESQVPMSMGFQESKY